MKAVLASPALRDGTWSDPQPGAHDLLVRVEAIALNPVDAKVRAGLEPDGPARILGWDGAGVVVATGVAVERFQVGDGVMFAGDIRRAGCQAELVAVDGRLCGRRPAGLSWAETAALPLTGLTAWEGLFEQLGFDPEGGDAGRSLLVLGAAGGVGSMAVQLARRAGLRVIASASRPESRAWVRELGAEAVVDHRQPLAPQLRQLGWPQVDAIANLADTDAYWQQMGELVRPHGSILLIVSNRAPLEMATLKSRSLRLCWEFMFSRSSLECADLAVQGQILERLATLIEAGELRSTLRQELTPIHAANLERAYAQLATGHTLGKIVLTGWS